MVRGVMWCLSAMEIPPAGAPPGGGVRLRGNVWWVRVIFGEWCRFAQDDTWGTGARDEKQNAVSVRKVKCRISQGKCHICQQNTISFSFTVLYFTPNICGTAPLLPPCHPERSGTPGVRANVTTKHCRAVEPRPPGGAPAGGISVVPAHPRNAPAPPSSRTERSEGKDLETPPQTRLGISSRKRLQEFQSFTAKGTRNAVRIAYVPPHGCPLR